MTAPTTPPTPPGPIMPKHTVLLNLLEGGHNVMIHLDPRRPGTLVPLKFQREPAMVLEIGYALMNPIPDLDIAEDGIGATLSFGGRSEYTFIPWSSVYGMAGKIGSIVWPEDLPPERRALVAGAPAPGAPAASGVIDLDARRTPKDLRACNRRRAAAARASGAPSAASNLTAPRGPDGAA